MTSGDSYTPPPEPDGLDAEELELLAAYVDDRLPDDERRAVERLLATSERAREIVGEVAAFDEAEAGATKVVPLRRRLVPYLVGVAAAAVLAALLLRGGPIDTFGSLAERVASSPTSQSAFNGWAQVRGADPPPPVARLAARWFDVRVLVAAGLPGEAETGVRFLSSELETRPDAQEALVRLTRATGSGSLDAAVLAEVGSSLRSLDPVAFDVGVSLAVARHAALNGDRALMRSSARSLAANNDWLRERLATDLVARLVDDAAVETVELDDAVALTEESLRGLSR